MSSPYQLAIHGRLIVIGKEPDGDSVRFVPDDPGQLASLRRSYRIRPSSDGSVQLRFEAVDAPELHYGTAAQPLGALSRDRLLGWIGFTSLEYGAPESTRVTASTPASVPAAVLSVAADPYGRPIAYVLVDDQGWPEDGVWTLVDEALLARTLNARLLAEGMAYPTFYTSTPQPHRRQLRGLAGQAHTASRGVWELDQTAEFQLIDQASIGPDGQLILPKLFRRATDYLKDVARGFRGNLADWLLANAATPSRSENDTVVVGERIEVPLSTLLVQQNARIRFQADLFDISSSRSDLNHAKRPGHTVDQLWGARRLRTGQPGRGYRTSRSVCSGPIVPVVGWLAAPHHGHGHPPPRACTPVRTAVSRPRTSTREMVAWSTNISSAMTSSVTLSLK